MDEQKLDIIKEGLIADPFNKELNAQVYACFAAPDESRLLIDFYRQLQRGYPDDWRYLVNLSRAYSATGKDSLAVVQLQKILRNDPSLLEVWMDLATCYFRLNKIELALRTINSAIDIDPGFEEAHAMRVQMLIEAKEYQEAALAVVLSLTSQRLSEPMITWLESLDEFLESKLTPPSSLAAPSF